MYTEEHHRSSHIRELFVNLLWHDDKHVIELLECVIVSIAAEDV